MTVRSVERPNKKHRLRQFLQYDGRYRLVELVGIAEVEGEDVADEDEELGPDGLVQAVWLMNWFIWGWVALAPRMILASDCEPPGNR